MVHLSQILVIISIISLVVAHEYTNVVIVDALLLVCSQREPFCK